MGREMTAMDDDVVVSGFHNPLFSSTVVGVSKDKRLFPAAEGPAGADDKGDNRRKSSSMVMRRHIQKDGRQEGAMVDTTRQRPDAAKRAPSARQVRRLSSLDVPACVVVKGGEGSDAGEILQHCAFHMEAFRVHSSPKAQAGSPGSRSGFGSGSGSSSSSGNSSTTFLFVFHGGQPNQASLEITHTPRRSSTGSCSLEGMDPPVRLPPSPSNGEGRVTMTLGGNSVPHLPGEPYSCHIRQVGTVTFNPRKQAQGNYLYILSQEGRTLFTALR